MSNFIDISDENGKHWCINTAQILYIEDLRGMTAFHINDRPEPIIIITYLKYDSVIAKLDAR